MKKYRIMLCVLACMCGMATACSEKKETPEITPVPEVKIMGYRQADIRLADNFERVISLDTSVGDVYIFGQLKTGGYSGYTTDDTFREYESLSFIPQKNETVISSALLPFGKKAVLTYLDGTTMIYIYGKDGVQENVIDCGKILDSPETKASILPCGREHYVININDSRLAYADDNGYVSDINIKDDILGFSRGEDNTVSYFTGEAINNISFIDGDKINISLKNISMDSVAYASCMSENGYIGVFEDGIYSVSDKKTEKITDFANMDFKPSDVTDIIETDNGYAVNANGTLYFITEDDITELSVQKKIWVGSIGNHWRYSLMEKYTSQYNETHDYNVSFKEYADGDALYASVISGNAPNIIPLDYTPLDSYGNNSGLFADMYTFLDSDPDLTREDFLPNILSGLERDGKLYQLGTSFIVQTLTTTTDTGIPENWTVDDMIETYENLGKNETLFPAGYRYLRETWFTVLFDSSMYIDYDNAMCSFDSPDFVKYLEFFQKNQIGMTMAEYNEAGEEFPPVTQEEANKNQLIDYYSDIYNASGLHNMAKGTYKDKMAWAGYVGNGEKSGTVISMPELYAISAVTPDSDIAWDFFKTIFSDIDTGNTHYMRNFPVIEKDFDEELAVYTRNNAYVDYETGKTVIEKWKYNDEEIECFTPEECEYYKDKILSARIANYDRYIQNTIYDEVAEYFDTDGDVNKTAKSIQKKVSEYLSENYT
ncbi:MAG: ABC transporter substrate-binding protein [Ruminococcus flavefaciens]|nr:ABC transporter substrate-binding protein [Ruminococcus flavefaciens]